MTDHRFPNYDSHFEPSYDPANEDHEEQCRCDCCCSPLEEGEETFARFAVVADASDRDGAETACLWVCLDCATPEERSAAAKAKVAAQDKVRAAARVLWEASGVFIDDDLPF